MRRLAWLLLGMVLGALPASAQYPEVDALLEAFFAKDLATVARHLPPSLEKSLSELPPKERGPIEKEFLLAQKLNRDGMKITRANDGQVLVAIENAPAMGETVEIVLDRRISDGAEAVLRLRARGKEDRTERYDRFEIWMRYVDGEWRIYEAQPVSSERVNLENPELLERLRHSSSFANEASAVGALRTYNTAFITYAGTYPEVGFPPNLDVLGYEGPGTEVSSNHSGLVDSSLSTPPYERSGYRFTYRPGGGSPLEEYTLVARPIEFGATGKRSFFTDQSGVIRYTAEDREPTAQDKPLQ